MGVYAEGNHQAEEHSRRASGATVQLRGLYDALHVLIIIRDCLVLIYFDA